MSGDHDVQALRFRIQLEELVTALSTRLLNTPSDELPKTIAGALAQLGELFGIDRTYVLRVDDTRTSATLFEDWWAPGLPQRRRDISELPVAAQRWWVARLRHAEVTHFPSMDDVPSEAEEVRLALVDEGVRSLLLLPLTSRGGTDGFLGFEGRRREYEWSPESIALMGTVGEIVVNALDRARSEAALAATAAELERRNDELERSNRELEEFASIASHDLKAPLRVVRGFLELLDRTSADVLSPEAIEFVRAAQRGSARMEELVDDLLAYSRAGRSSADLQRVDLGGVLAQVLADSAANIDEAGAVVTVGDMPTVLGDETQLRQLFQNLVTNAVKFRRSDTVATVHVAADREGKDWRCTITDNGIGIGLDHRDDIFTMFSRLHSQDRYPGTGIGLAVCQKVVESHGGRIWVEDAPGGGTRFAFTFPA